MSSQYGELRPTNGWDLLASLGHHCKFQRVLRLGSVTARQSSSGRQPNYAALNRGRHLYSAGRSSRWALAHISSLGLICDARLQFGANRRSSVRYGLICASMWKKGQSYNTNGQRNPDHNISGNLSCIGQHSSRHVHSCTKCLVRSFSRSTDLIEFPKIKNCYLKGLTTFSLWQLLIHKLLLTMISLCTKFETLSFSHSKGSTIQNLQIGLSVVRSHLMSSSMSAFDRSHISSYFISFVKRFALCYRTVVLL